MLVGCTPKVTEKTTQGGAWFSRLPDSQYESVRPWLGDKTEKGYPSGALEGSGFGPGHRLDVWF